MSEVIEGNWDELLRREDLQGRRVRVIVLDEKAEPQSDPWLKSLQEWADSHPPVSHFVDDSRESIYSGTTDDPR